MAAPPTKRPRRCEQVARAGKRDLAPDTASPPEKKRSRKGANSEAEGLLASGCAISDYKVLQVLRLWKFTENVTRVNVMPRDAAFVLSDTLGLVSTRTGVVSASRLTRRYPAVFEILSLWLRQSWPLAPRFPFTSISVNYNYAARMHRDSNNVGTSLTRAFGEFRGGSLRYWGEDDGCLSFEELGQQFLPTALETGKALCLFDGRRAHAVEPFDGERYSLVFFCMSAFARAREDVLSFVSSLGAHIPTSSASLRAIHYLAPAKGYDIGKQQRGIREMCGMAAKPTCLAWSTPSLMNIGSCLDNCLSFVISPALMSSFCAVARAVSAACQRPSSWCGTVVDASGCHPKGSAALTHFKRWSLTKAVVGGSWERGSLSFLVDRTWVSWGFVQVQGTSVLVSRFPVPSASMHVMFSVNRAVQGKILVGIAINTGCQDEITTALRGRPSQGTVAVAAVMSSARCRSFRLNDIPFGPTATPVNQLRGIVQFSVVDRQCVAISVPGKPIVSAKTPTELPESASCLFFVVLPPSGRLDEVRPCWSRRA